MDSALLTMLIAVYSFLSFNDTNHNFKLVYSKNIQCFYRNRIEQKRLTFDRIIGKTKKSRVGKKSRTTTLLKY